MQRIIMHWTAGTHIASSVDREHYHILVQGDGSVVYGDYEISDNISIADNRYAAHTRNLNTGSIGVAVCAMKDARQVPFDPGKYPITEAQLKALVREVARLAKGYNIPVTRKTILSHAEVQPTLGVAQAGKWDIAWIPGWPNATDPLGVGDCLRSMIRAEMAGEAVVPDPVAPLPGPPIPEKTAAGLAAAILMAIDTYMEN